MALNENLQNVVNDLKEAKESIATALINKGQTVASDDGFGDFANKVNNLKPQSYQDTSGVTATASDVLNGKSIVDANGQTIPGTIPVSDFIEPTVTIHLPTEWSQGFNTTTTAEVDLSLTQDTYIKAGNYSYDLKQFTVKGKTYIPSTKQQELSGYHVESYITGDSNLISENIKSGVSIFGVNGTASCVLANGSTGALDSASQASQYLYIYTNTTFTNIYLATLFISGWPPSWIDTNTYTEEVYCVLYNVDNTNPYQGEGWNMNIGGRTNTAGINEWNNWVKVNPYPEYNMLQFYKSDSAQSAGWLWPANGFDYFVVGE